MPTALVTGANRGLGLETSKSLAQRGYSVLMGARDPEAGRRAAEQVGASARAVTLDVTLEDTIYELERDLTGQMPLDVLVNNAGASFDGFDSEVARRTLEVNYRGPVRLTEALLPRMSERANVVMVSSGMGELHRFGDGARKRLLDPSLDQAALDGWLAEFLEAVEQGDVDQAGFPRNAYSVSKAALNAYTRILSREFAGTGRRINAVCPGWVRTRMGGPSASRSLEEGASGVVWAATLGEDGPNGGFFRDGKPIEW